MKEILFTKRAHRHLLFLEKNNPKYLEKALRMLEQISETPRGGIGRPERLQGYKVDEEFWSGRLDKKNRIVYEIKINEILILTLVGHYSDK